MGIKLLKWPWNCPVSCHTSFVQGATWSGHKGNSAGQLGHIVQFGPRFNFWSFERKTYTWSSRKSSHSMKSGRFQVKSARFHMDFTGEICRISYGFHRWNLPDFRWNLPDFIWISRVKSAGFHEIRMKSAGFRKTIARNGKPYVFPIGLL